MSEVRFKDHFSQQAERYSNCRPRYPEDLFQYLTSLVSRHECAWDCATGNGQAALGLTPFFDRVIATDASGNQIAHAIPHEKISYRIAPAEHTTLTTHSVDLIIVAQALHWFDFNKFYDEVRRVGRERSVLAASCYGGVIVDDNIDGILLRYEHKILGQYWPPERQYVDERFQTIPFPFEEIRSPLFMLEHSWDMETLLSYLASWSATKRYEEGRHENPIDLIRKDVQIAWGNPKAKKLVRWQLNLRVGRVDAKD